MKLLRIFFYFFIFGSISINAFSEDNLKDIVHLDKKFSMRVPVEWLLLDSQKSISYSMDGLGGKMDVRFWDKKDSATTALEIESRMREADKVNFEKKEYVIGEYRVISFFADLTGKGKRGNLRQSVNLIQFKEGFYVVQFVTEKEVFNSGLHSKVLATFSSEH